MKSLFAHPFVIYAIAGFASLCIMIIIDYLLGPEAEHLNAWVIVNRWAGNTADLPESLAIRKLGLAGASIIMLAVNALLGSVLILILKGVIRLVHS